MGYQVDWFDEDGKPVDTKWASYLPEAIEVARAAGKDQFAFTIVIQRVDEEEGS